MNFRKFASIGIATGLFSSWIAIEHLKNPPQTLANSSLLEFRWDNSSKYKKLYYSQSSKNKRDRSTYYLVIKPGESRTALLKLKVTFPSYFDAKISPKKLTLCKVNVGGMLAKTKCIEKIPAIFEVSKDQSYVEVFPDAPIPSDEAYAMVMKIFNPSSSGMFQLNALGQSPGDVPISSYIGSWSIDIQ